MSAQASPSTTIRIQRTDAPRDLPGPDALEFGRVFTDHMLLVDYEDGKGWHAPRIVPFAPLPLSPAAAGLHYAQTMFDGLKAFRGADGKARVFRIEKHCRRMSEGAARLAIPPPDPAFLKEALLSFVGVERRWIPSGVGTSLYLRPTIIATEPFLGVRPAKQYLFFIIASPVGAYYKEGFGSLKILIEDKFVRAAPGGLGAVKASANYAASLLAGEEAKKKGFSQVLWTDANEHRYLEEVGTMNLFVKIGDEIATPGLEGTILGGVTRDTVLSLLRKWGHPVRERRITVDEVIDAQKNGTLAEVFGTGTGVVIAPVGELGWKGEAFRVGDGQPGPLARKLLNELLAIQNGTAPDPDGWVTEVG